VRRAIRLHGVKILASDTACVVAGRACKKDSLQRAVDLKHDDMGALAKVCGRDPVIATNDDHAIYDRGRGRFAQPIDYRDVGLINCDDLRWRDGMHTDDAIVTEHVQVGNDDVGERTDKVANLREPCGLPRWLVVCRVSERDADGGSRAVVHVVNFDYIARSLGVDETR
jgi:hypothetical protein